MRVYVLLETESEFEYRLYHGVFSRYDDMLEYLKNNYPSVIGKVINITDDPYNACHFIIYSECRAGGKPFVYDDHHYFFEVVIL
jgi:hypothetical protein